MIFSIGGGGDGHVVHVVHGHWMDALALSYLPRSVTDAWHVPAGFISGIMCICFAPMESPDGWPMHDYPGMPATQEGRRQQLSLWQDMNGCAYRLTDCPAERLAERQRGREGLRDWLIDRLTN